METQLYIIFVNDKKAHECTNVEDLTKYMTTNKLITTKKWQAGATLYIFAI